VNQRLRAICVDPRWQGRSDCEHCSVRASMLFAPLDANDLDAMLHPVDNFRLPAGGVLFRAGQTADHVVTVRRGYLTLRAELPDGSFRILRLLRSGDVAGDEALHHSTYRLTAVALGEVDLCRIPVPVIRQMAERRPEIFDGLHQRWEGSLVQAERFMLELLSGEANQRVARLLCFLQDFASAAPPRLSRQEMAAVLGLTMETTSRVCSAFMQRGWLSEGDGSFSIDRAALEALFS